MIAGAGAEQRGRQAVQVGEGRRDGGIAPLFRGPAGQVGVGEERDSRRGEQVRSVCRAQAQVARAAPPVMDAVDEVGPGDPVDSEQQLAPDAQPFVTSRGDKLFVAYSSAAGNLVVKEVNSRTRASRVLIRQPLSPISMTIYGGALYILTEPSWPLLAGAAALLVGGETVRRWTRRHLHSEFTR